jgi:O-antigen/teichoic acid export membrane protein
MSQISITNQIKELFSHGLIYGIGSIAQSAAGFILLPLYAEHLLPHDYGVLSLILMIGTVFGSVFYLGASSALQRSYFDYADHKQRIKVFNSTFVLLVLGALMQIIIGALFSHNISKLIIGTTDYSHFVFVNMISSALFFINTGFLMYFRLLRKSIIVLVTSSVNILFTLYFVYYFIVYHDYGIAAPIYASLVSQILSLLFCIIYFRNSLSLFSFSNYEIIVQLKFGLPNVIGGLSMILIEWGDRFLINQFLTTSDVGTYSMGFRMAALYTIIIVTPFTMIWNPMMMEYRKKKNVQNLFEKVTYYYTLLSITLIIICVLFLDDILKYIDFGSNYTISIELMPYIMFGLFIGSLINIFSAGIFYQRKPILFTYIYLPIGGINILLNIYLLPIYGIWGAVISGIISRLALAVAVYVVSGKYFMFKLGYKRYVRLTGIIISVSLIYNIFQMNYSKGFLSDIVMFSLYVAFLYYYSLSSEEKNKINFRKIKNLQNIWH